jgi:hypothetical protein
MSSDMTIIQAKEERKENWSRIAIAVQQNGVLTGTVSSHVILPFKGTIAPKNHVQPEVSNN